MSKLISTFTRFTSCFRQSRSRTRANVPATTFRQSERMPTAPVQAPAPSNASTSNKFQQLKERLSGRKTPTINPPSAGALIPEEDNTKEKIQTEEELLNRASAMTVEVAQMYFNDLRTKIAVHACETFIKNHLKTIADNADISIQEISENELDIGMVVVTSEEDSEIIFIDEISEQEVPVHSEEEEDVTFSVDERVQFWEIYNDGSKLRNLKDGQNNSACNRVFHGLSAATLKRNLIVATCQTENEYNVSLDYFMPIIPPTPTEFRTYWEMYPMDNDNASITSERSFQFTKINVDWSFEADQLTYESMMDEPMYESINLIDFNSLPQQ